MAYALVIFESTFGDNEILANEIAAGLASRMSVEVVDVGSAPQKIPEGLDLLIVGGPTNQGQTSISEGLGRWLDSIDEAERLGRISAVAFGTNRKTSQTRLDDGAEGVEKRIRELGFSMVVPAQTFFLADEKGPLMEGEADRARQWGKELLEHLGGGRRPSV